MLSFFVFFLECTSWVYFALDAWFFVVVMFCFWFVLDMFNYF